MINISKHVNMLSLEKLMKMFIDLDLDKFYQVSDWRIRPLPSDMLDYARNDSHYLIPLYLIFIKLLNPFAFSLEKEKCDLKKQNQKNLIFNDELYLLNSVIDNNMT